jgi:FkbM family methyltransferase
VSLHDYETATIQYLERLLPSFDSDGIGLCIEAGAGADNWYWQTFHQLGHTVFVVEPLPTEELRKACRLARVTLFEGAISDHSGTMPIYSGRASNDWASLERDWWGVLCGDAPEIAATVSTLTYIDILQDEKPRSVSCLKLDIEGHELAVLRPLYNAHWLQTRQLLPRCVVFEYGGGGQTRADGVMGWSPTMFANTLEALYILQRAGYGETMIFDETLAEPRHFHLQRDAITPEWFPSSARVGNIVAVL